MYRPSPFPITKRKSQPRSTNAFSLVTVLCSGLIGAMWIAAAYSMLLPLVQQSSAGKQSAMMRTLAETAVDYVAKDISTCFATSQLSKYDDSEVGAPYTSFELTPAQLGIEDSGNKGVKLTVIVKNEYPGSENESAVYDFQTVPSAESKKQWSMVNAQNVGWRTIEVHVGLGSSASAKAVYRAMMRPDFGEVSYATGSGSDQNKNPFFPEKMPGFGTNSLTIKDNASINGNLGTNGSWNGKAPLNIDGKNIAISGKVTVNSLSKQSDDNVASGINRGDASTPPSIKGYLLTNGQTSGFTEPSGGNTSSSGVTVTMPSSTEPGYDPSLSKAINPSGITDQSVVAPAPSAPAGATDLGSISLSGNAKLVIRNGPVEIPTGQSLSNLNAGTAYIPPGDYKISSLDMTGNSSIQLDGTQAQPTSFYVDNAISGNTAVNVGGAGIANSTSGNLQFWYNGTNAINLSGAQSTMSVYAPNAPISISGKGAKSSFKGAILGSSVEISNANLELETPIASTQSKSGSLLYDASKENGKTTIKPHALRKIIWQELNYSDYIKQGNTPF